MDRPNNGQDEGREVCTDTACPTWQHFGMRHWHEPDQRREQIARELARHQHLMGRRNDDEPQWSSWCDCGWDGGPVEPSRGAPADVRAAFRLHVADELLALLDQPATEPCRVYSHGTDGWHCAVQGEHNAHRNAAGTETW